MTQLGYTKLFVVFVFGTFGVVRGDEHTNSAHTLFIHFSCTFHV